MLDSYRAHRKVMPARTHNSIVITLAGDLVSRLDCRIASNQPFFKIGQITPCKSFINVDFTFIQKNMIRGFKIKSCFIYSKEQECALMYGKDQTNY